MEFETKLAIAGFAVVAAWMLAVAAGIGTALFIAGRFLGVF